MKQVLLMIGVLLLVMLGYYWASTRNPIKKAENKIVTVADKQIYFGNGVNFTVNQESEIKLLARDNDEKVVSYWVEFNYDPSMMKIENVEINKDIFDKKAQVEIDETMGKVKIVAQNSKNRDKLAGGEVLLATLKIKSLKKGTMMIYASRKPEIGILVGGKEVGSDLVMPNFKINIL